MTDHEEASDSYKVTAGELRQFVERIERLEAEKKDIAEQVREVYAESNREAMIKRPCGRSSVCASATRMKSPNRKRYWRCTKKPWE